MMKKKALITGITGQSGLFLTRELLKDKDYEIVGISRNKITKIFYEKLNYLNVNADELTRLNIIECNLSDPKDISSVIKLYSPTIEVTNIPAVFVLFKSLFI